MARDIMKTTVIDGLFTSEESSFFNIIHFQFPNKKSRQFTRGYTTKYKIFSHLANTIIRLHDVQQKETPDKIQMWMASQVRDPEDGGDVRYELSFHMRNVNKEIVRQLDDMKQFYGIKTNNDFARFLMRVGMNMLETVQRRGDGEVFLRPIESAWNAPEPLKEMIFCSGSAESFERYYRQKGR